MGDLFDNTPTLPSPKRRGTSKIGMRGWSHLHAAYSKEFSDAATSILRAEVEKPLLFDPFVGSGTTLESAREARIPIIAADLDPVAALLTRTKAVKNYSSKTVNELLRSSRRTTFDTHLPEASDYFSKPNLAYATAICSRLADSGPKSQNLVKGLIESTPGRFDNEVVALCSVMLAAPSTWHGRTSSNPTWRKSTPISSDSLSLPTVAKSVANRLMFDLDSERNSPCKMGTRVFLHDATTPFPRTSRKPNIVITSPPYLTRIDYVKNHLPEIAILNSFQGFEIRGMRDHMIGTPTIPKHLDSEIELVSGASSIVSKIENHPSYKSEAYYAPFYRNYFSTLQQSIQNVREILAERSIGIIVVQQSRYKELVVDLPSVVVEQLERVGANAEIFGEYPVGAAYANLNPRHAKVPRMKLYEKAIRFELQ